MGGPSDPRIEDAKRKVEEEKKKVDSLISLSKSGVKISGRQFKEALREYELALDKLARLLNPNPLPPATGRSYTDPHFVGLDGQSYDVMPEGAATVFAANIPPSKRLFYSISGKNIENTEDYFEKDFCVTGLHTSFRRAGERHSEQMSSPTWTIAVFIKIFECTLFYDTNQNLLLNGVPATKCGFFSTNNQQEAMPGYYYLDPETLSFLEVWHPVFGRVVVHNVHKHNLNLTFSVPQDVLKEGDVQGMVVGKQKTTVWEQEKSIDMALFGKVKAQNPSLSDQMIRDMVFDYQYTSPDIRDKVLELNLHSVEKQNKIIENEKNFIKWIDPDGQDEEDDDDDVIDPELLQKVHELNVKAERLLN